MMLASGPATGLAVVAEPSLAGAIEIMDGSLSAFQVAAAVSFNLASSRSRRAASPASCATVAIALPLT
jgi:hypothetical protein